MAAPNHKTHNLKQNILYAEDLSGRLSEVISNLQAISDEFGPETSILVDHEIDYGYSCCGDSTTCYLRIEITAWTPKTPEEMAAEEKKKKEAAAKRRAATKRRKEREAAKKLAAEEKKKQEVAEYLKAHPELLEELKD